MSKKTEGGNKTTIVNPHMVDIYTDGSLRPIGASSCAYVAYSHSKKAIIDMAAFSYRDRTINQMELMAVNRALDIPNLKYVTIFSDSTYTIGALAVWRKSWALRGWLDGSGEPVKNMELIKEIGSKIDQLKFCRFVKVAAHTGDHFNTLADYLATTVSKMMVDNPLLEDRRFDITFKE